LHDAVESGGRDYDDFLMIRYSVLALCIQRTNDRRGSRQLTSFSLAMGFRGLTDARALNNRFDRVVSYAEVG
jgi:hypothetical protein